MAKKRVKRYDEGGDIEDESDRGTVTPEQKQAGLDSNSFGDAFKMARSAGDKTFTWKGKSYSTAMASDKPKAAPKAEPKFSPGEAINARAPSTTKAKELLDSYVPPKRQELSKTDRIKAADGGKFVQGATPMKKGGAVRGCGIAQRGLTKGRVV